MKVSAPIRGLILLLAFTCSLAGCGNKPQPGQDGAAPLAGEQGGPDQSKQRRGKAGDEGLDEAGRIMAEAIKGRAASSGTPQTPAEVVRGAAPTPPLGTLLGVPSKPFISFEGRFIVTPPPGFLDFERSTQTLSDGKTELHLYRSHSPDGSSALVIGYADLSEVAASRPPTVILEAARDRALETVNGTLEKQENLTIQGQPALSFYGSAPDQDSGRQVYFRYDAILKLRRFYSFCYTRVDNAKLNSPETIASFKSFVLLD